MWLSWGNGSTGELFIYPNEASYAKRDFEFRISSASIECELSEFTILNGFSRLLMPLDNALELFINEKQFRLEPFDVIRFDGGLKTTSRGICTDLGIMLNKNWQASMQLSINPRQVCQQFSFVYALEPLSILENLKTHNLNKGDFLILQDCNEITLDATHKSIIMHVYMKEECLKLSK